MAGTQKGKAGKAETKSEDAAPALSQEHAFSTYAPNPEAPGHVVQTLGVAPEVE